MTGTPPAPSIDSETPERQRGGARGPKALGFLRAMLARWHWAVLAYAVLLATVPVVPVQPFIPGIDPAWSFALNRAVAQDMVFGRDIVFTYGPYQSVFTGMFDPQVQWLTMLGGLVLALSLGTALFLVLRGRPRWVWVLVALPALLGLPAKDALGLLIPLVVLEAVWVVLREHDPRHTWRDAALLGCCSAAFGVLPIIKFSMVPSVGMAGLLGLVLLAAARRWLLLAGFLLAPLVTGPVLWLLAHQPLSALPDYVRTSIPLVQGYSEAMMDPHSPSLAMEFVVTAVVIAVFGVVLSPDRPLPRTVLGLMVALTLFMAIKAGFVREDHAYLVATVLPATAALVAARCRRPRIHLVVVTLALVMCASTIAVYQHSSRSEFVAQARVRVLSAPPAFFDRVLHRDRLVADYQAALARIRAVQALPRIGRDTDIYSYNQSQLLAARPGAWNPRPVLQSYAAYTPELLRLNAQHLTGPDAPRRVLFRVEPIDRRLPALEDGLSWLPLMEHYRPVGYGDLTRVLAWQRRSRPVPLAVGEKTASLRGTLGREIPVPATSSGWLATIRMRPTLSGRVRSLLWRSSGVLIDVTTANGVTATHRFVPEMGRSQFLLSPMVRSGWDMDHVARGQADAYAALRVNSIRLRVPAGGHAWAEDVEVQLSSITLPGQTDSDEPPAP